MFDNSGDVRREIMACLRRNVEYFQPGIVNRIHFSKGPMGYSHEKKIQWSDEAIQRFNSEIWGVPKVPDSGVSSTTPPLAFGAGELAVGVGIGVGLELVGLFGVRLDWLFAVGLVGLGCLQLGWLGSLGWVGLDGIGVQMKKEHGQVGWSETDCCWASWKKPLWNGDPCGVNNMSSTFAFFVGSVWWMFLGGVHPSKMSGYVKDWFGKQCNWMGLVEGGYNFDGSLLEAKIWQRWCMRKDLRTSTL